MKIKSPQLTLGRGIGLLFVFYLAITLGITNVHAVYNSQQAIVNGRESSVERFEGSKVLRITPADGVAAICTTTVFRQWLSDKTEIKSTHFCANRFLTSYTIDASKDEAALWHQSFGR